MRAGKSVQIAIAVKEATSNQGAVSIAEWAAASAVAVAWAVASAGKCDVGSSSGVGLCRRQRSRLVVSVAEWACSVGSGVGLWLVVSSVVAEWASGLRSSHKAEKEEEDEDRSSHAPSGCRPNGK